MHLVLSPSPQRPLPQSPFMGIFDLSLPPLEIILANIELDTFLQEKHNDIEEEEVTPVSEKLTLVLTIQILAPWLKEHGYSIEEQEAQYNQEIEKMVKRDCWPPFEHQL